MYYMVCLAEFTFFVKKGLYSHLVFNDEDTL